MRSMCCIAADKPWYRARPRRSISIISRAVESSAGHIDHLEEDGVLRPPMHGKLLAVLVQPGATVTKGQRLAVIEAMKMEHTLLAPVTGRVSEVLAAAGSQIAERATVMVITPDQGQ